MKKVKYFIFSIICLFSCSIVFAENEVIIKSITPVYDENSSIVVTNDNNNHSVTFNEKDQVVKYNVVIENTSGYELTVEEINISEPTQDFIVYEIIGLKEDDVLKSEETKELVVTLKTIKDNNLDADFNQEFLASIDFEKSVSNPFTSTKGLIIVLLFAACVTGASIVLYRKNKLARYVAMGLTFISIVPIVKAEDTISLSFEVNAIYKANFDWSKKTATFVGDSITNSVGTTKAYYEYLDDSLDFTTTTVMGVNGSTFSAKSDYGTSRNPLISRYQNIPQSDLILIYMGTNDYGQETPLGSISDDTDVSFYGALNVIISNLKESHPNSVIVLATPIHRYGAGTSAILGTSYTYDNIPNGRGLTLEDYVNAMKDIANKHELPLIDLFTLVDIDPTDVTQRTKYIPDGLHPNAEGHKIIANVISEALLDIKPSKDNRVDNEESNEDNPSASATIELTHGNDFSSDSVWFDNTTRVSTTKNIYLEKGTVVYLNEPTTYNFAVYKQTAETMVQGTGESVTTGWTPQNVIITEDGWYGITVKKISEEDFELSSNDSKYLNGYVSYQKIKMQLGNQYSASYVSSVNRMSVTRNVYLKKGTTINIIDPSTYMLGVFNQNGYNLALETTALQSWKSLNFIVPSDGWYGIAFKRVDDANLNFGVIDPEDLSGYVTFE